MLAKCQSIAVFGIEAYPVEVEVDVRGGLPDVTFVGLPDTAVKEARDRVKSALSNSGYANPRHHTIVNLAPADIKKEGPAFDLPIAVGMLAATGQVKPTFLDECMIVGELALDGRTRPVRGVLSMAMAAKEQVSKQAPHRTHRLWSIACGFPFSPLMASTGHSFTQAPHPRHFSEITS